MLENANDLKPYTLIKYLTPQPVTEVNATKQFKPKNYTVPMDFDGDRFVYVYKKLKKLNPEPGPDFSLNVLDLGTMQSVEVPGMPTNLKLVKLFKNGIVYIKDNRMVHYYDFATKVDSFLYNHQLTIVTLAVHDNLIATIDKGLAINIMKHDNGSFLCNDLNLMDFQNLPADLMSIKLFEMEYPYFSALNDSFYAFTSDFGTVMVGFNLPLGA